MLDKIINTRFFERNSFVFRQKLNFLNLAYDKTHSINVTHYGDSKTISEAQDALKSLTNLINSSSTKSTSCSKTIWMYWNSPLDSSPDVVQMSVFSWKTMNPDHTVNFINDDNIADFLGFDLNKAFLLATVNMTLAMKADILRLCLLTIHGGVWVDTTTFCLKPLSLWLYNSNEDDFFCFRHSSNKTRPLEAWFIASNQGNTLIKGVLEQFIQHVFKPRHPTLFVSNQLKPIKVKDGEGDKFGLDIVKKAEEKGFMPYFSISYFFNHCIEHFHDHNFYRSLDKKTNNHSLNNDSFDVFSNSLVSKQTYKKDYQDTQLYKERKQYILSLKP